MLMVSRQHDFSITKLRKVIDKDGYVSLMSNKTPEGC